MDEYGRGTFDWPAPHTLRHKPLQAKIVDNNSDRFFLGANGHMPLLVFICDPAGGQRSDFRIRERKLKKRPKRGGGKGKQRDKQARRRQQDIGVLLLASRGKRADPR